MVDWGGNMTEKKDRIRIILFEVEIESTMVRYAKNSKLEYKFIDDKISEVQLEFEI